MTFRFQEYFAKIIHLQSKKCSFTQVIRGAVVGQQLEIKKTKCVNSDIQLSIII